MNQRLIIPFPVVLVGAGVGVHESTLMVATFAGAALLLAGLGVHAMLTASVRQRTHEIGIRVALGASLADVRGLVVREAMRLVGAGAVIGLLTAVALTRVVQSLLFSTSALDPVAMATAVLTLVATSALATYVPIRRAVRVDPIVLLKTV
jgi:ABC-type antimicrobial peptide transport system permease subunit